MREHAIPKLDAIVDQLTGAAERSTGGGRRVDPRLGPADHAEAGVRNDVLVGDCRRQPTRSPPIQS
jgi:hypothetical protein